MFLEMKKSLILKIKQNFTESDVFLMEFAEIGIKRLIQNFAEFTEF